MRERGMTHRSSPDLGILRYEIEIPNVVVPSDDRSFFVPEWNHGDDPQSLMEYIKKSLFSIVWEPGKFRQISVLANRWHYRNHFVRQDVSPGDQDPRKFLYTE
jgi:hypothetical protein